MSKETSTNTEISTNTQNPSVAKPKIDTSENSEYSLLLLRIQYKLKKIKLYDTIIR